MLRVMWQEVIQSEWIIADLSSYATLKKIPELSIQFNDK